MTTLLSGAEPAVDALVTKLTANLATYVTAVNALFPGGTLIETPAQILPYVPPLDQVMDPSLIGVGLLRGRAEDDTGSSMTGYYGLAVVTFVQDADQLALTRKVMRLHRAVYSCVMEGRNAGVLWGLRNPQHDFGQTLANRPGANEPPGSFLTWFTLTVEGRLEEQ